MRLRAWWLAEATKSCTCRRTLGRFLVHGGGEPTTGVLKLVRPEFEQLSEKRCTRLARVVRRQSEPIPVKIDGETKIVALTVRPTDG